MTLEFSNEQAIFLFLNIIAHDVIHDYKTTNERWSNNQKILSEFYKEYTISRVTGGSETVTMTNDSDDNTLSTQSNYSLPPRQMKLSLKMPETYYEKMQTDFDMMDNEKNILINQIKSDILLRFFKYIILSIGNPEKYPLKIGILPYLLIRYPSQENIEYTLGNVYDDIADSFWTFCMDNKIMDSNDLNGYKDIQIYLSVLFKFLSENYVELAVYKNVNVDFSNSINQENKKRKMDYGESNQMEMDNVTQYNQNVNENGKRQRFGGAKKEAFLTPEECKNLIEQTDEALQGDEFNTFINELQSYVDKLSINSNDIENFKKIRWEVIQIFTGIFVNNGAPKCANSLNSIKILTERGFRKINFKYIIYEIINETIQVYRTQYNKDKENQKKIEDQRLADEKAKQQGDLTSQEKDGVSDFVVLIAKMGLYSTGIIDADGKLLKNINNLGDNSELRIESDILSYIAGWPSDLKNADLDNNLYSFFKTKYKTYELNQRYKCIKKDNNDYKYIINNASKIEGTTVKEYGFCPYSSIIDGMSQCSWNTSGTDGRESGNMNFIIKDKEQNYYYNGQLTIDNEAIEISLNISLPKIIIKTNKRVNTIKDANELEAWVVLKNTLLKILDHVVSVGENDRDSFDQIVANNKVFENLFKYGTKNPEIFVKIYSEILFKGVGDLFQEINSVAKNGGYNSNYQSENRIKKYFNNNNPNPIRLFVANDRPSACRFMFMLINGDPNQINKKAFGGYFSMDELNNLLIKRSDNSNVCENVYAVGKGGTKKMKKGMKIVKLSKKNKVVYTKTQKVQKKSKKTKTSKKYT